MRHFGFNSIVKFLISLVMCQLTNWANIGFWPYWFLFGWSLSCSVLPWAQLIWKWISSKENGRSSIHVMKSARSQEVSSHDLFWIPGDLIVQFRRSSNSNDCCLHLGLWFRYLQFLLDFCFQCCWYFLLHSILLFIHFFKCHWHFEG